MNQPRSTMSQRLELGLARPDEAVVIAALSRELVESGLNWSWRPARVMRQIRDRETLALAARHEDELAGFAIMGFGVSRAHLNLLAVKASYQNLGIGWRLMRWLEESARVAGLFDVDLEVRAANQRARRFYRSLGYRDAALLPLYYDRREAGIRMTADLRVNG